MADSNSGIHSESRRMVRDPHGARHWTSRLHCNEFLESQAATSCQISDYTAKRWLLKFLSGACAARHWPGPCGL